MKKIIADKSMYVKGVVGMFAANRSDDGEDVELYEDEAARAAGNPMHTFCMLRQQAQKENDEPYLSQPPQVPK